MVKNYLEKLSSFPEIKWFDIYEILGVLDTEISIIEVF